MANPSSFLSLQFSQALAIRSYTKFVMGVSQASCSSHCPVGLGGASEAGSGRGRRPAYRPQYRVLAQCVPAPRAQVRAGGGSLTLRSPWLSDCSEHADLPLSAGR